MITIEVYTTTSIHSFLGFSDRGGGTGYFPSLLIKINKII